MRHPSPPDEDASSRSRTASLVRTDFDDTLSVVPSHAPGPHITAIEPLALLRSSFEYMLRMLVPEARVTTYESVEAYDGAPTQFVLLGLQPRQYKDERVLADAMRALQHKSVATPIGIALHSQDAPMARRLMRLGAAGVLLPSISVDIAAAAIRLMIVGGFYLPPELAQVEGSDSIDLACAPPMSNSSPPAERQNPKGRNGDRPLTSRERQILKGLRAGSQNKNIAYDLGISESTVKVHLRNMMRKLHASNRTQIAVNGADSN
jgi:DNA-binding NarL/FixJ family response regulator